jgi:signal transduction histidine kinase
MGVLAYGGTGVWGYWRMTLSDPGPVRQQLRLEIGDDGVGMPECWRPGVGITAMRERVAALGGELGSFVSSDLRGHIS